MERHNDLNTIKIAVIGFLAALITFAIILALQVLYYSAANEQMERKVIQAPTTQSDTLLAEQAVKLTRYDWIDREKKKVDDPHRPRDGVGREGIVRDAKRGAEP